MLFGRPLRGLLLLAALIVPALPASAQLASSVSVGIACSVTVPLSPDADAAVGPSFVIRLRGNRAFSPLIALNWFTTPFYTDVAGERTRLGSVSIRPLLLGLGYTRNVSRRVSLNASVGAGIAFGHARGTDRLKDAYDRLGLGPAGVRVPDSLAWRLSGGVWVDLSRHVGMTLSVGYLGVRPDIVVTTNAGERRRSVDLGSVVTSIGFAYGIF